jgi:peptidoglycan/LPS O-acetylase OafA/YrhL
LATFFAVDFAPLLGIDGPRGMGPPWSLAVEEQFYFIWPFLVLNLSKRRLALLALAIVVCSSLIRIAATDNTWHAVVPQRWFGNRRTCRVVRSHVAGFL